MWAKARLCAKDFHSVGEALCCADVVLEKEDNTARNMLSSAEFGPGNCTFIELIEGPGYLEFAKPNSKICWVMMEGDPETG